MADKRARSEKQSCAEPTAKRPSDTRRICPHCAESVSERTYYRHKRLFYSSSTKTWQTEAGNYREEEPEMWTADEFDSEPVPGNPNEEAISENAPADTQHSSSDSSDLSEVDLGSDSDDDGSYVQMESASHSSTSGQLPKPLLQLLYFVLLWQAAFKVSNAAICAFLRFLKFFCLALGKAFQCPPLTTLSNSIPITKETLQKALSMKKDDFIEFIVCPKCDSVYSPETCQHPGGGFVLQTCTYTPYPKHPMVSMRKECGTQLMKTVRMKNGTVVKPRKVFPYQSIQKALQSLLQRPGFLQCCEKWRTRKNFREFGYLCDIYDGLVWEEYKEFLSAPYNYLLTLNVDWFCPFEHGRYSVGAIYITIQNLPASIRNHPDNIILVGVIPGPSEPHFTLNSYLAPLITELLTAWNEGFPLNAPHQTGQDMQTVIRAALTCVACDIPASRKVCGFLGHRATLGCNKCLKEFKYMQENNSSWTNYAGFDRSEWVLRTDQIHRQSCKEIITRFEEHGTKTALEEAQSQKGLRYSLLLELPYFDATRYPVLDPMHNLFLGTGKHVMDIWLNHPSNMLNSQKLRLIEDAIHNFIIPDGIGRLPNKITSHFGGFTADQWRNWITIYSSVLLWHILDAEHWECWTSFVKAVKMICCRVVKLDDVLHADSLLQQFCVKFQELYGERSCSANMHLHLHLYKSLQDYGPTYAFWLYAFERYNGILGSFHTNNRGIETQIMRRFLETQSIRNHASNSFMDEDFLDILPKKCQQYNDINTDFHWESVNVVQLLEMPFGSLNSATLETLEVFSAMTKVIGPFKEKVLTSVEVLGLTEVLKELFPMQVELKSKFYFKFGKVMIGDDLIGSTMPNCNSSSSMIMANWPADPHSQHPDCNVGEVQYFMEVLVNHIQSVPVVRKHVFAFVHWRRTHVNSGVFPKELAILCEVLTYPYCKWNFLPIHRISNRVAHVTMPFSFSENYSETVTAACPLPLRIKL